MSHPIVERRRAEQQALVARARDWAQRLADRLPVDGVVVFGSVARGDFNRWSDLDVLVLAERLPRDARARLALLHADAPPGLEPLGWTPEEFATKRRRGDPIACEASSLGIVVWGQLPASDTLRNAGD
jgi:predicted nucleotidyltransferase